MKITPDTIITRDVLSALGFMMEPDHAIICSLPLDVCIRYRSDDNTQTWIGEKLGPLMESIEEEYSLSFEAELFLAGLGYYDKEMPQIEMPGDVA